jgi:L-ascorbate metabolism protein UlaG (beta-lactamase superfamily)
MQIKKFRHSCLELTIDNQAIVIDPGGWSTDFVAHPNIIAVIITHEWRPF